MNQARTQLGTNFKIDGWGGVEFRGRVLEPKGWLVKGKIAETPYQRELRMLIEGTAKVISRVDANGQPEW